MSVLAVYDRTHLPSESEKGVKWQFLCRGDIKEIRNGTEKGIFLKGTNMDFQNI